MSLTAGASFSWNIRTIISYASAFACLPSVTNAEKNTYSVHCYTLAQYNKACSDYCFLDNTEECVTHYAIRAFINW